MGASDQRETALPGPSAAQHPARGAGLRPQSVRGRSGGVREEDRRRDEEKRNCDKEDVCTESIISLELHSIRRRGYLHVIRCINRVSRN